MKNIIKLKSFLWAIIILLAFSSCEDVLNRPPANQLSSEGFYNTPAQCEQSVIGIYAGLRNISDLEFLNLSEVRSDNTWVETRPNGQRDYSDIGTFKAGDNLATISSAWNRWYSIIYNANVAITKIADCDFGSRESFKNQLLGEAYFIRGWAYFEMTRLFGNIPLIDKPASPSEIERTGQSTPREIYDKIVVRDLLEAKAKLPLSRDMVNANGSNISSGGRADRIAAQAMLGRIYMTMAGFPVNDASAKSLAETELKAVLDFSSANNEKYWAPDSVEWRKQWMPNTGYYNKYSIFAIQYREGGTGNPSIFNFSPSLPPTYTSIRIFGNGIWVEMTLAYEFERIYSGTNSYDARGNNYSVLTGYDAEPNWPSYTQEKRTITLPNGSEADVFTRTMIYKFLPTKRKLEALGMPNNYENSIRDYNDWGVNFPIIRLEDVMLMYAEILIEKGDIAGAMNIVNKIRTRAGCDPEETTVSAADALYFVKRERRVELLGEGVRWFDLIRWNEWKSSIEKLFDRYNDPSTDKANIRDGRYLYPVPMTEMNVKPGLYQQNEGY